MAVFDDTQPWSDKLLLYPHKIRWENQLPIPTRAEPDRVDVPQAEPLRLECEHFLQCIAGGNEPVTNGDEGLRVLKILNACQRSLDESGARFALPSGNGGSKAAHEDRGIPEILPEASPGFFVHPTAIVDGAGAIGAGVVWVVPVLWCDVTEAALLPRRDRLRVDAAGVGLQLPLGGLLLCAGRAWQRPELLGAGGAILTAVAWNALPFARTDAYWLLCDALGVASLARALPAGAPLRVRRIRRWWRVGRVLFAAGLATVAVARVVAWARGEPTP
ncbi:hypothetical protein HGA89_06910 [bacterium]|nr:hypothetical protein [bacterium]